MKVTRYLIASALSCSLIACSNPSIPIEGEEKAGEAGEEVSQSCYGKHMPDHAVPAAKRELFVLIDQTTGFDPRLIGAIQNKAAQYLSKGPARVNVGSFSAQTSDHFATVEFTAEHEMGVDKAERDDLNVRSLEGLEHCLTSAGATMVKQTKEAIGAAANSDSGDFQASEVLASLTQLSKAVSQSQASEKVVLVASDLLEHSKTTSFYQGKAIRTFDIKTELQKALDERLIGDFNGANIYVIGAGTLPPEAEKSAIRGGKELANLESFWENWFANSNATLAGYGQPNLMERLQ